MSLTQLEEKINKEGVLPEKHEIWEDSIQWRNAVEEQRNSKHNRVALPSERQPIIDFSLF